VKHMQFVVKCSFVLALITSTAFSQETPVFGKYQFYIQDGVLMRGSKPFLVRAVYVPNLFAATTPRENVIRTLNHAAEVGATTVCFDLPELQSFGDDSSADTVKRMTELIEQVTWRQLGAICRVPAKDEWQGSGTYANVLRRAATALKDLNRVVFWLDGKNVEEYAKIFQENAPELLLAAADHAPIRVVPYHGGEDSLRHESEGIVLWYGAIPPSAVLDRTHFMVDGTEENYASLDKAMALPIESQPWEPDNSLLTDEERQSGWISLFDGKTLNGWAIVGPNPKGFQVIDGAIVRTETNGIMLRSRDRYDNFILRLEWKINPGGNSGVFLRAPRAGRVSKIGMEFQIMGDSGTPVDKDSTGAIYDVVPPLKNAAKPEGEWNDLEISLNGSHLRAVLNGEVVQDLNLDENDELRLRLRKGFIAFQDHGHPAAFRHIRIKPL